ncbi:MAG: putative quinol monooxygenase [Limisphaerales bacterium]
MIDPAQVVSIHPYFKVHPGQMDTFKALLTEFIARTAGENGNLCYDFTIHDDVVFCREAYVGAEGLLTHLTNVGATVQSALQISDLLRVEVHGAAAELEKLKGPLADLKPTWFVFQCGVRR